MTIFLQRLRTFRGSIVGWGIGLFLLGLLLVPFYETIAAQGEQFERLLEAYPPEFMAFFGAEDLGMIATPQGYLSLEYFAIMPVLLGIFAVIAGSGLVAAEEENGTLDLLMAYPVSRSVVFFGRVLALEVTLLAILAVAYLGIYLPSLNSPMNLDPVGLIWPYLSLFAVVFLFAALSLLLSLLLPSRRMAGMVGGLLLVGSYFLTSLANLAPTLKGAARFSPMSYYQSGDAMSGLHWGWFSGLLLVAGLLVGASWLLFERRDIRVGGEGGWQLLFLRRNAAT